MYDELILYDELTRANYLMLREKRKPRWWMFHTALWVGPLLCVNS